MLSLFSKVWAHPECLGVFAAGNVYDIRSAERVMDPSSAKNVLSVGATQNLHAGSSYEDYYKTIYPNTCYSYAWDWSTMENPSAVAPFSLGGPCSDGRVKPDVVAPGSGVVSLKSSCATYDSLRTYSENENYVFNTGTSMSTPLVAGAAALAREWLVERRGFTNVFPTAALMKAILTGGAHDMSVDRDADCGGAAPNTRQGWGLLALADVVSGGLSGCCCQQFATTVHFSYLCIRLCQADAFYWWNLCGRNAVFPASDGFFPSEE